MPPSFWLRSSCNLGIVNQEMESFGQLKALTLRLTPSELDALDRMAQQKRMSKDALVRHCIRVFVAVEKRISNGDKLYVETPDKEKSELLIL
jgi:hypothetical protein